MGSNDNCNYCSDSNNVISLIREIVMVSCLVVVIVKVVLWDIIIIVFYSLSSNICNSNNLISNFGNRTAIVVIIFQ